VDVSADSNAALFLNGHLLFRKVTRYQETNITADRVLLPQQWALPGANVLVVRHHNWGNIECFQRTGQVHAGLWLNSNVPALLSSPAAGWRYALVRKHVCVCVNVCERLCFGVAREGAARWVSSVLAIPRGPTSPARLWQQANEHVQHDVQVIGIGGAHRIRFPQVKGC
jgi:hypothetical protein